MKRTKKLELCLMLTLAASLVACRGGGGSIDDDDGESPPLSDATRLACPRPGALPFATEASGFSSSESERTANERQRSKDEAADWLGVSGDVGADTYFGAEEASVPRDRLYRGKKARSTMDDGLSSTALAGEAVSLWAYDPGAEEWQSLGRTTTDPQGFYQLVPTSGFQPPLGAAVYSVLEADGSCAPHYDYELGAGTKIILTDIDGTLTLSDEELFREIADGSYLPEENRSASRLMQTWADKGYVVVYLSARPHAFRAETRSWLSARGYPDGPVVTANTLVFNESARIYKRSWANRLQNDLSWQIVAAYGNAGSDIDAYEDAGIPKSVTFIVGELAGAFDTQAIDANDYSSHIEDFVLAQPDAR